jgi:Nickel responsive protein SCO4226-like
MKRYVIERDLPGVGSMSENELRQASSTSNSAISQLFPKVQWQHSYVTAEKTFCIYLAEDENAIHQHAEISGFPANLITEVTGMIDPATAA